MPEAQQPEVRPSTVVVTGETREAFMSKKLDIAAPDTVVKAEPQAEPIADGKKADEKQPEAKKDEPREKTHPIKERFSELTQARKDAEEREAKEREGRIAAERETAELRAKLNPKVEDVGAEPQRAQFANDEEYNKAVVDHRVDVRLAEKEKANQEEAAKAEHAKTLTSWKSKVADIQKEVPDYAERLEKSPVMVSNNVRDAIIDSDVGPRILLHLADNPAEGERIGKMTVRRALMEIGKLEEKYTKKPEAKADEPKAEAKEKEAEISKAPAPISPLKGAGAGAIDVKVDSNGVFHGTYAQWKEARKAGKIK